MAKPIYIKVGGSGPYDPAAGATDCNIPTIKGQELYLEKVGTGTAIYNTYSNLSTGGFRVVTPFVLNDEYFVHLSGLSYGTTTTSYTNGFCFSQVMTALFGRVGWIQSLGSEDPVLNATNLISRSGRYFNDGSFHALTTLQNIKSVMEQIGASDADFNTTLERLQRSIILKCLNGVFSEPEFIQQTLLYNRNYANDSTIQNTGKFSGIRIIVPPVNDVAIQIDSVALMFDSDVTFNLYLFNDAKSAPVWMGEVEAVANTQTIVQLTDIVLNHIGGSNHGGIFYLGYFQDDIGSAKAIYESNVCFVTDTIFGYEMIQADAIGSADFNRNQISYNLVTNGLNPHISVFRDHTWHITKKPALFDNVIGIQMAAMVLEEISYSKRSNSDERLLKDQTAQLGAYLDLNGVVPVSDGPQTFGLKAQVLKELSRVKKSFYPKQKSQSISVC
ncbi:MAG: hypothetical protein KA954_01255 [Chitinophagales bacterium]|nr:hypothetical protein [Chitinophagales bacterium]MBP9845840.1 hypothetical protein [Saprospiraceae bacterium]